MPTTFEHVLQDAAKDAANIPNIPNALALGLIAEIKWFIEPYFSQASHTAPPQLLPNFAKRLNVMVCESFTTMTRVNHLSCIVICNLLGDMHGEGVMSVITHEQIDSLIVMFA